MKNKVLNTLFSLILVLSLSSCDLSALTSGLQEVIDSTYNEINGIEETSGFYEKPEDNTGNSLQLLNETFNGTKNDKGQDLYMDFSSYSLNYNQVEGSKLININKNITDYEYLDGYTPASGNIKGLVIPIDFPNYEFNKARYFRNINVSYQSVASYYYNSSYGKLNLSFDILPWYRASKNSYYYENMTESSQSTYKGDAPGVSCLIHEALTKAARLYDLSKYDANNDGYIDSLHIIYNYPTNSITTSFWWAYQYVTLESYKYDGLYSFPYVFASFNFLFEDDENNNARTFIHETGHMLGLEDYYDYDTKKGYNKGSLGGFDIMDCSVGQHNVFSKISLGWIDKVLLVNLDKEKETTITINDSTSSGNVIMVCDDYKEEKGMFQTYFLFELIDVDSPLLKDEFKYLTTDGIRVYRVNASLKKYTEYSYSYEYYTYDNSYTTFNLIDAINAPYSTVYTNSKYNDGVIIKDSDLFTSSDVYHSLPYSNTINERNSGYLFKVNKIENNQASITFKRS